MTVLLFEIIHHMFWRKILFILRENNDQLGYLNVYLI